MTDAGRKEEEEGGEYKMEIKLLEKKGDKLSFTLKGIDAPFANAIRRMAMDEVPTMAIEDVEFTKNSSILYDEMVAHRLGLVPLKTDLKSYNLPDKCTCKGAGCAQCQLSMTLGAKKAGIVYAVDIKSKDPKVVPLHPKIPILKLIKGQDVELTATAILGKGKEHSKWSPGFVHYSYKPIITVNNKSKLLDQFRDKYPPQVFDKSGQIQGDLINTPNLIDAVDGICDDIVKVEYKDDEFVFYVESWGQLSPKDIITNTADIVKEKADEFADKIKDLG